MRATDYHLMRITLATVWLVTGVLSLGVYPVRQSLELLERVDLHGDAALSALYGSAILDIAFGVLTLLRPSKSLWCMQASLIITYSAIIALRLPEFWLHPFGPLLKNLPILLLLWLLFKHKEASA